MEFTGERFMPSCQGEIVYEHWHRYLLASEYAAGKRVLDIASGEGYGSALLARTAAEVTGVDISAEAVAHASERYRGQGKLSYLQGSCDRIPLESERFDLVVSFETVEHIHAQEAFIDEIDRVLAPGGLLLISSPNRDEYSTRTGYKNEFHVEELDGAEFRQLLSRRFEHQKWFGQMPCFQSLAWPLDSEANRSRILSAEGDSAAMEPLYYLAFCARETSTLEPVEATLSLVADADRSVYREWGRTYAENRQLHERNRALREELARLRERAPAAPPTSALRRLLRRLIG